MTRPQTVPSLVLMTADAVGGVWQYALALAKGLAARDVSLVLATMGRPPTPEQRRRAATIPGLILEESAFRLEWMANAAEDTERAGDWLLDLERRHRPDIVHLNSYAHAALPWRAPVLTVCHSCVLSWWRAVHGAEAPSEWNGYRKRVATGLRASRVVVAPTRAFLNAMDELHGPFAESVVVHNGALLEPDSAVAKEPVVFAAGRLWDAGKNLAALNAAAQDLPWPVVLAGDLFGPDGPPARFTHVRCLGPLDHPSVLDWMARASLFAAPALYEPFGLAVLEAAAAGCALVLSDIATLRELWTGAATFVDPTDAADLRAVLRRLIDHDNRQRALQTAARRRAARYRLEAMTTGYLNVYAGLLSKHPGPSVLVAPDRPFAVST